VLFLAVLTFFATTIGLFLQSRQLKQSINEAESQNVAHETDEYYYKAENDLLIKLATEVATGSDPALVQSYQSTLVALELDRTSFEAPQSPPTEVIQSNVGDDDLPKPTETIHLTPTPDHTPTPSRRFEFIDNFDSGLLHPDWQIDKQNEWTVVNKQLVSISNEVDIYVGDIGWNNYSVELDINSQPIGGFLDIILMKTETTDLKLRFHHRDYLGIVWYQNGMEIPNTKLTDYKFPLSVRITAIDGLITTYIDGQYTNQFNAPNNQNGMFGIYSQYNGCTFDNIKVVSVE
jgi:hypothetical protein